jgi:hypothetical protein
MTESPVQQFKRRIRNTLLITLAIVPVIVALKMFGMIVEKFFYIAAFFLALGGTWWLERKVRKM